MTRASYLRQGGQSSRTLEVEVHQSSDSTLNDHRLPTGRVSRATEQQENGRQEDDLPYDDVPEEDTRGYPTDPVNPTRLESTTLRDPGGHRFIDDHRDRERRSSSELSQQIRPSKDENDRVVCVAAGSGLAVGESLPVRKNQDHTPTQKDPGGRYTWRPTFLASSTEGDTRFRSDQQTSMFGMRQDLEGMLLRRRTQEDHIRSEVSSRRRQPLMTDVEGDQREPVIPAKPTTSEIVQPGVSFDRLDLSQLIDAAVEKSIAKRMDLAAEVKSKKKRVQLDDEIEVLTRPPRRSTPLLSDPAICRGGDRDDTMSIHKDTVERWKQERTVVTEATDRGSDSEEGVLISTQPCNRRLPHEGRPYERSRSSTASSNYDSDESTDNRKKVRSVVNVQSSGANKKLLTYAGSRPADKRQRCNEGREQSKEGRDFHRRSLPTTALRHNKKRDSSSSDSSSRSIERNEERSDRHYCHDKDEHQRKYRHTKRQDYASREDERRPRRPQKSSEDELIRRLPAKPSKKRRNDMIEVITVGIIATVRKMVATQVAFDRHVVDRQRAEDETRRSLRRIGSITSRLTSMTVLRVLRVIS